MTSQSLELNTVLRRPATAGPRLSCYSDDLSPQLEATRSHTRPKFAREIGSNAVRVQNVNLTYRTRRQPEFVLNHVHMTVPRGAIYGLLGPSGCGKTSLLKCIMGLKSPDNGSIRIFGHPPGSFLSGVPGPCVGYMPQDVALNLDLTIRETWTYFARVNLISYNMVDQRISQVATILDLPLLLDRLVGDLSGGQQRRTSFGASILHQPRLLILDEPTVGVDPLLRTRIWNELSKLTTAHGVSVIITTHYIEEAKQADLVGFIRKGTIITESSPDNLLYRFKASSLEEVFLKLCQKHKRNSLHYRLFRPSPRPSLPENDLVNEANLGKDSFCPNFKSLSAWFSKFRAVYSKNMIQLVRQPETLVASFLLPIIILLVFCVCIGGTPSGLPIGIVNEEFCGSNYFEVCLSEQFIRNIDRYVFRKVIYLDYHEALEDVHRKKLWAVIRLKAGFTEALKSRITFSETDIFGYKTDLNASLIRINGDLTDFMVARTLEQTLLDAYQLTVSQHAFENPRIADLPIAIASTVFGRYSKSDFFGVRDYAGPGLIVVIVYCISFALTAFSLLLEKQNRTLTRNFAAGVSKGQIILANLFTRFVFTSSGAAILLLLSVNLLEIPCRGSIGAAIGMLLLQTVSGMSLGILLASITPDMFTCCVLANGYLIFTFIISGVLWPTETLPYYLRWFSSLQATTQATESLRSILIRGLSVTRFNVYFGYLTSLAWIVIVLIASSFTLKLQDD